MVHKVVQLASQRTIHDSMILRSWELRAMDRGLWPARWGLLRYLDDVTVLHANEEDRQGLQTLKDIYPPDLPFSREAVGVSSFTALDLWVVCLSPLRTAVSFKPTNRAIYIPSEACVPWHIKAGFIKTKSIRYLRLVSEHIFYQCPVDRLCSQLISIGYSMPSSLSKLFPGQIVISFCRRARSAP